MQVACLGIYSNTWAPSVSDTVFKSCIEVYVRVAK